MIDVRAESIIYQSQIYYRDLLNNLVVKKRLGKALTDQWNKADLILGYLEALNYKSLLTDETDILNVNYILECLIKLCELNQYPVLAPLTFQAAPAVIVGAQGATGATGLTGPRGYTGLATDFSSISVSATTVVDSFPISSAKAARWDYHVINASNAQRASSIIGHWTADGSLNELVDNGADDLVGATSGIEFDIVYSASTIQLVATITSGTWSITGSRYFIPNNGNGSGAINNVLPLGQIYIGNASNQAQAAVVTGDVLISTSGVTSINTGVIVDADINASANITLTKLASLNNNIVPITNGSGKLVSSTLSPTTLAFVDIGSSLTGLLTTKLTDPLTTIGDLLIRNGSNVTTRLGIGSASQVLTVVGGLPAWQNVPAGISGLTVGFIPKANSTTSIVNSIMSESASTITIAGKLVISTQESWVTIPLINGWTNNTGTLKYRIDSQGRAHLSGHINAAASTSSIFANIPAGLTGFSSIVNSMQFQQRLGDGTGSYGLSVSSSGLSIIVADYDTSRRYRIHGVGFWSDENS